MEHKSMFLSENVNNIIHNRNRCSCEKSKWSWLVL